METLIGTCGYDYAEWVGEGRFYPASLAKQRSAWLTYYASQFPILELNFTYYSETTPEQTAGMVARVDPSRQIVLLEGMYTPQVDFKFVIKAYAGMTHQIGAQWQGLAAKYITDIEPLHSGGKLLGILAQFPSRFRCTTKSLAYVTELASALAPHQLIVEFRHRDWFAGDVQAQLTSRGVVFTGVDAPKEAKLPGLADAHQGLSAGTPFHYLRLHGRREGYWWSGDAGSRYEYRYNKGELTQLAARLTQMQDVRSVVVFNNHRRAGAARNARELQNMLQGM